jgi:hypothetical protein
VALTKVIAKEIDVKCIPSFQKQVNIFTKPLGKTKFASL